MTVVAVLGMGAMGSKIAEAVRFGGHRVVTSLSGRSEATHARARASVDEILPALADVLQQAEVVLSVVPPGVARPIAYAVASLAGPDADFVFSDCNAVSPDAAREMESYFQSTRVRFADSSILGPPPVPGVSLPYMPASGPAAGAMVDLLDGSLRIVDVGGHTGKASAIKMCYGAFVKGSNALAIELFVAAERLGVADEVRGYMGEREPARLADAERPIPSVPSKAGRWVDEMEYVGMTFDAIGLPPGLMRGAADIYRFIDGVHATGAITGSDPRDVVRQLAGTDTDRSEHRGATP